MTPLLNFARWLAQKFAGAALIVVLGLAAYGLWLFLRDTMDLDRQRLETVRALQVKYGSLAAAKAEVEQRIAALHQQVETQQQRAAQARKVLDKLRELESWWARWWPWSKQVEQQKANAEQVARMTFLAADATTRIAELKQKVVQTGFEKQAIELHLDQVKAQIAHVEGSRSQVVHYLERAWESAKWLVLAAVVGYFCGPTLWALVLYFGFAPFASRGRPIQLGASAAVLPAVSESHVSIEAALRPGDVLRIKEKFLQASDEGVRKKTRFVLDWAIPFTSAACGLIELVELRGRAATEGGLGEYRITLSNGDDPHIELAFVDVPEGASLILRPSFLAGVIQREDRPLRIRRHWRIFRWQSWITGQFRFFEFVGPCRLVVAGSRGVRAEVLATREGVAMPARRTNQDATIGFTPDLEYRPVRAETFWSYYRGMNPLFDDLFAGRGLFILQETASDGGAARAGRFWSGVWSGLLKVFGL